MVGCLGPIPECKSQSICVTFDVHFEHSYADPVPSRIVRKLPGDGPILDISSKDLACNEGGESDSKIFANITAGSDIKFI